MIESVTLKLDKEGGIVSTMKASSLDAPGRLGALSGKGLAFNSQTGKHTVAVACKTVAHKVDTAGERPRIKTMITVIGDGGLEKILGHTVDIQVIQRELPGFEDKDGEEEEEK
jgi:hypothetical protein